MIKKIKENKLVFNSFGAGTIGVLSFILYKRHLNNKKNDPYYYFNDFLK